MKLLLKTLLHTLLWHRSALSTFWVLEMPQPDVEHWHLFVKLILQWVYCRPFCCMVQAAGHLFVN